MKSLGSHIWLTILILLVLLVDHIRPLPAYSAILYKSYVVQYDRGWDILCEPYIVQKNDWVSKLFRQKGEIAQKDYPKFISIFRRLNPYIRNIDLIRPGQYILIPLKRLKKDDLPGQSSGIVTIPFVTISKITEILNTHSTKYKTKKGDCVSILIARRFGAYGTESYKKGLELFKFINPAITDPNFIYTGQVIHIPDASLRKQPWYYSLFDSLGNTKRAVGPKDQPVAPEIQKVKIGSPFLKTASILNAKLLDKGTYYFPGKKEEKFELDLSKFPMLEFKDGTMIIFPRESQIKGPELSVLKSFWSDVNIVSIAPDASMEQILDSVFNVIKKEPYVNRLSFSDHGVKTVVSARWITDKPYTTEKKKRHVCITLIEDLSERTPESISRYMDQHSISIIDILVDNNEPKQKPEIIGQEIHIAENVISINPTNRKVFVNDLVTAIGFNYAKNIKITFPYAGIQVEAISNLVTTKNGSRLLIDFEDLYGDAITSIQKTGFDIIQVKKKDNPYTIIQNLLTGIGVSYTNDPTFFAAKRPVTYNTALTIHGFLVTNTGSRTLLEKEWNESDSSSSKLLARKGKMLLAVSPLHEKVIQFLKNEGVRIIMIGTDKAGLN